MTTMPVALRSLPGTGATAGWAGGTGPGFIGQVARRVAR